MAEKHSSDSIKKALNDAAGISGSDKDWKRRSKSRNADGEWERVFEHAQSGTVVCATEHADGSLSTRILDETDKAAANKQKAAKYCFAVGDCESDDLMDPQEEALILITPISYFNKTGYCYDQPSHLYDLLPDGADDVNECGTYIMPRNGKSDLELAKDLIARGFVWRSDFQDLMHKALDSASRAELAAAQAAAIPDSTPAAPKGPKR